MTWQVERPDDVRAFAYADATGSDARSCSS